MSDRLFVGVLGHRRAGGSFKSTRTKPLVSSWCMLRRYCVACVDARCSQYSRSDIAKDVGRIRRGGQLVTQAVDEGLGKGVLYWLARSCRHLPSPPAM